MTTATGYNTSKHCFGAMGLLCRGSVIQCKLGSVPVPLLMYVVDPHPLSAPPPPASPSFFTRGDRDLERLLPWAAQVSRCRVVQANQQLLVCG